MSVFERHSAAFDAELRKQVDLLWPREVERLEAHGLREAASVLDLGTGNGYFLSRLARRHPKKSFTGIEASPSLAAIAGRRARPNMTVVEGSCPLRSMRGRFDLVFARLALYCMPDRARVLRWAHGLLARGGRIAVIDIDDSLKSCWPPGPFWEVFAGAMKREIGPAADRNVGRKLPHLLLAAGFRDVRIEFQPWFSSTDLSPKDFSDFWGGTVRQMTDAEPEAFGKGGRRKALSLVSEIARSRAKTALTFTCVVSAAK